MAYQKVTIQRNQEAGVAFRVAKLTEGHKERDTYI